MTEAGVIPHHDVCACGEPIKRCPDTLGDTFRAFCLGWVHVATALHTCRSRPGGLAEPAEATVPP